MTDPSAEQSSPSRLHRAMAWASARRSQWLKGLLMLLYVFVLELLKLATFVIALIQFGFLLVKGEPNARLATFGGGLARFAHDIVAFLSCATERAPFPFSEWPRGESPYQ